MTHREKPDAAEIRAFVDRLKQAEWLGSARAWWPSQLFHFSDMRNVVEILEAGELLSRAELERQQKVFVSAGSPQVLAATAGEWKDHVRLYFRPRTPTQYNNEGCRPTEKRKLGGAHCPVPVFLVFDSKPILCREDVLFSEGNLAAGAVPGRTAEHLAAIPFEKVYHDSSVKDIERANIVFHRHAEVIVPQRLDLSSLKWIACRSEAEYESLLELLSPDVQRTWQDRIVLGTKQNLFFRRWTFVERVAYDNERIVFTFNVGEEAGTVGFRVLVTVDDLWSDIKYAWEQPKYTITQPLVLGVPPGVSAFTLRLSLDGDLAYVRRVGLERPPF